MVLVWWWTCRHCGHRSPLSPLEDVAERWRDGHVADWCRYRGPREPVELRMSHWDE